MNIIVCHNFYQHAGGEDSVFRDEVALLASRGHRVIEFTRHNDAVRQMSSSRVAMSAVWNRRTARELRDLVRREEIDVVHFHNTWPLISPAAYSAARSGGAAVVQTLHNYRMLCPGATFFRDGSVCESCIGKRVPWPAIQHGCYRDSRAASTIMAATLTVHRALRTYHRHVDRYIALSQFSRAKLIDGGLPAHKVVVKPNFVVKPPETGCGQGNYALYLGRLSPEKGITTLLAAWRDHSPSLPLRVVGDGPQAAEVRELAAANQRVQFVGPCTRDAVFANLREATLLVVPSVNYEGFPRTIVESFAVGTPVVASRLGSLIELVDDERTGAHFKAGDPADLAATINRLACQPAKLAEMRRAAVAEFDEKYTPDINYGLLTSIYAQAIRERRGVMSANSTDENSCRKRSAVSEPIDHDERSAATNCATDDTRFTLEEFATRN